MCFMCFMCLICLICLICSWTHRWPAGPCFYAHAQRQGRRRYCCIWCRNCPNVLNLPPFFPPFFLSFLPSHSPFFHPYSHLMPFFFLFLPLSLSRFGRSEMLCYEMFYVIRLRYCLSYIWLFYWLLYWLLYLAYNYLALIFLYLARFVCYDYAYFLYVFSSNLQLSD